MHILHLQQIRQDLGRIAVDIFRVVELSLQPEEHSSVVDGLVRQGDEPYDDKGPNGYHLRRLYPCGRVERVYLVTIDGVDEWS